CDIILTLSLRSTMNGALLNPAITGKNERTKDVGHSLGIMAYVFNCSEQLDRKTADVVHPLRQKTPRKREDGSRTTVQLSSLCSRQHNWLEACGVMLYPLKKHTDRCTLHVH
ncbi:unnamed protein product, partial [Lepidochelys olivacea]